MDAMLEVARTHLRSRGLSAEEYCSNVLNVWATENPSRDGIKFSHDMSRIYTEGAQLRVVFPGPGQLMYTICGDPSQIIELVGGVYTHYRDDGGTVANAVAAIIPDAEKYIVGQRK